MNLSTTEALAAFIDAQAFSPVGMRTFMDAIDRHPPDEGHKWRLVHWGRRSGTIAFCSKCKAPVGLAAVR